MKSLLTIILLYIQATLQQPSIIPSSINGKFPKAINISNEEVLLLYDTGHTKFQRDTNSVAPNESDLFCTDEFSNVFRLNKDMLVLVKGTNMNITIFQNDLQIVRLSESASRPTTTEMYQYSIISDSKFAITYDSQAYLCELLENTLNVNFLSIVASDKKELTCDYSEIFNGLLCGYTQNNKIKFVLYDFSLNRAIDIDYSRDGKNPLLKANKQFNTFSLCYYINSLLDSILKCESLKLLKSNSAFNIINSLSEYSIKDDSATQTKKYYDLKFIGNNLFIVYSYVALTLHHLSPSNIQISRSKSAGDCTDCSYPFIYSIGSSIGFVYQSGSRVQIAIFDYNECNSYIYYSRISTQGTFPLIKPNPNSVFRFYEYADNSLLYQRNTLINLNTNYEDNMFTYLNFHLTGKSTWLYIDTTTPASISTLLCQVTLMVCYSSCKECKLNLLGDSDNHQCTSCLTEENYYPYQDNSNNCGKDQNSSPSFNYFLNSQNQFESCDISCATCVRTANNCLTCSADYYPLEDNSTICNNSTIDYYFRNNNEIVYKKCYKSCKTCEKSGVPDKHNCLTCKEEYFKGDINQNCYRLCNQSLEITDNKDICIPPQGETCTDYPAFNLTIKDSNECVSKCTYYKNNTGDIVFLFKLNNAECVKLCPSQYLHKYNEEENICEKIEVDQDNKTLLKKYFEKTASVSSISSVSYDISNLTVYTDKINQYIAESQIANINLIYHLIGDDYSLTYYIPSDEDVYKTLYINNQKKVSSIDFASFAKKNSLDLSNIIVMQWDIYRPNQYTNQIKYKLFEYKASSQEITEIPESTYINELIRISYHITNFEDQEIQAAVKLGNKGINIFNYSSPFYNDVCFKYSEKGNNTNANRDVSLSERRKRYAPATEMCELNCQFISIDEENKKANCLCSYNTEFSNKVVNNPDFPDWPTNNIETVNTAKCYSEVFKSGAIIYNAAFWLFLIFILIIICLALYFIYSGMAYANNYVLGYLKSNKNNNFNTPNQFNNNDDEKDSL